MKTELLFSTDSIVSALITLDRYEKHRLPEWLYGWEDLSDIIVIAAIGAMILITLFAALIIDGLEEYFNDTKLRGLGEQRVPISASSKRQHFADYRQSIFGVRVSSQNTGRKVMRE